MWTPGDGSTLVSFDTVLGKLGGLICWENFMPLPRMAMYQAGVQLHVAPTWDQSEAWQSMGNTAKLVRLSGATIRFWLDTTESASL